MKQMFALVVLIVAIFMIPPVMAAEDGATVPPGWTLKGSKPADYEAGLDTTVKFNGKPCSFVKSKKADPIEGFATLTQKISAENYVGKRLRFSGQLKSDKIIDAGGLWMRVDAGPANVICFDNMENRPVKGTTDWKKYDVVLDVPANSTQISYGFLLYSSGSLWGADFSLETVDKNIKVTDLMAKEKLPAEPVNLDFTRKQ